MLQVFGTCYAVKKYKRYAKAIEAANNGTELSTYCHRFSTFGRIKQNAEAALLVKSSKRDQFALQAERNGISTVEHQKWYRQSIAYTKRRKQYGMFGTLCSTAGMNELVFVFIKPRKKPVQSVSIVTEFHLQFVGEEAGVQIITWATCQIRYSETDSCRM